MRPNAALHWRFKTRRWWNLCLDWVFPDEVQGCLLCHRPFPANNHERNSEQESGAHTELEGVCPFCLQDAMDFSDAWVVRRLRVHKMVIPVVTAAPYEGMLRNAIRQWKYDGAVELTSWCANLVGHAFSSYQQAFAEVTPVVEAIVPVPTSADRMRKRGYDHVGLLASALSLGFGLPVVHPLTRTVDSKGGFTQSQTAKSKVERLKSLTGAYRIVDAECVRGKHVLLLDDVVTTGSTLQSCAMQLLEAGCASVTGLAIAHVL